MKLLTWPNGLGGGQRLSVFRQMLGFEHTTDPTDPDITVAIHYNKLNRRVYPKELAALEERGIKVWNKDVLNVKKDYVDDIFTEVFGYSLRLDPTKHRGMAVIKTSQQAVHGGKLIECPIPEWRVDVKPRMSGNGEPHYRQYQKFIDTRISKELIRDYRILYMARQPVMLFEKHIESRCLFHVPKGAYLDIRPTPNLYPSFSSDEIAKIGEFVEAFKLDFGEIDVLRQNSDGKIYIVDINDLPCGSVTNVIEPEIVKYLADEFKRLMLC